MSRPVLLTVVALLVPAAAFAQGGNAQSTTPPRFTEPPVIVTVQKEPADIQDVPLSVTAVPEDELEATGISFVSEAAIYAPNTYFSDFTARKLSLARVRGIGSSPANPGIGTYIDGVPQLNANSANVEFLDVSQVEFVRGPQSALYGRNTLGGLVSLSSVRPSLTRWTGSVRVPLGNFGAREVRASVSGPLAESLALRLAFGRTDREGFTVNDVTGNDLDYRSATFAKGQVLWIPAPGWEARAIVSGERARDGDYALNDLGALRRNPFHAARDFEGRTDRDIISTTGLVRHEGPRMTFSSSTGVVRWKTRDLTDLDYTPLPMIRRDNAEKSTQFSEEVRLASAAKAPVRISSGVTLKWQAGAVVFTQNYDQDAVNMYAPFLLSPFLGFPVSEHSPASNLDDLGVGLYAQATATIDASLDVTAGARFDHERKDAQLDTFYTPTISLPTAVTADRKFSDVSPQFAVAYRVRPNRSVYGSAGRGFKAGGFNPASPAGSETYGEEHAWHVEAGTKTSWADGRVLANAAVFSIDWRNLQLNLPNPAVPGQFYIGNVGAARSSGLEFELHARPHAQVSLFSSLGYVHARFKSGTVSSGRDVSNRELPGTPEYSATVGARYSRPVAGVTLLARGEVVSYGAFQYADANTAGQEAYSLANFRAGVTRQRLTVEGWVANAFDTRYIPVAFAYGQLAPSGFVGESGKPRTWGIRASVSF